MAVKLGQFPQAEGLPSEILNNAPTCNTHIPDFYLGVTSIFFWMPNVFPLDRQLLGTLGEIEKAPRSDIEMFQNEVAPF